MNIFSDSSSCHNIFIDLYSDCIITQNIIFPGFLSLKYHKAIYQLSWPNPAQIAQHPSVLELNEAPTAAVSAKPSSCQHVVPIFDAFTIPIILHKILALILSTIMHMIKLMILKEHWFHFDILRLDWSVEYGYCIDMCVNAILGWLKCFWCNLGYRVSLGIYANYVRHFILKYKG